MNVRNITLDVNGTVRSATAEDRTSLADMLRHGMGLTGTHTACEQGECGACTVLLDEVPVRSCLVLAVQAHGRSVHTVEGREGPGGELSPLQRALVAQHGLQCGFCTPGLLMALHYADGAGLSAEQAEEQILPCHLCRCTGYNGIRAAVRSHFARAGQAAP
jgi:aerobic-type carbon monoxide dehydrogenase small subunit (CoxS/CutS family)